MSKNYNDDPTKRRVFNDPKLARVMASQFYVVKELERNPAKALRFMQDNIEYFPTYENVMKAVMEQHNLTQEDIDKQPKHTLADLNLEQKRRDDLKAESEAIHVARKEDHKKRDFGHGIKPRNEPDGGPKNVYESRQEPPTEVFAKLTVNLKESEFRPKIHLNNPDSNVNSSDSKSQATE